MATTPPIKPLDGAGGYLRWKESVLLRIRTLGVAYVLFEARPTGDGNLDACAAGDANDDAAAHAAAKKWARDDALCRGHILATISDRLLPDYHRFGAAAELSRTYDVDAPRVCRDRFDAFVFEQGCTGDVLLEQIAHAEALGVAARLPDAFVAYELCGRLPDVVSDAVVMRSGPDNEMTMSLVWDVARRVVASGAGPERLWRTRRRAAAPTVAMADEAEACCSDGPKPEEQSTGRRTRGELGLVAKNSRRRV